MLTNFSTNAAVNRRTITATVFLATVAFPCYFMYRAAESAGFRIPFHDYHPRAPHIFPLLLPDDDSATSDSEEYSLERVLKDASMHDNTVILTTLNEAWAAPRSVVDLFLESFRTGEHTRSLLNHLVIISLDRKAFSRCLLVHMHCYALATEGVDFSHEAYFMTPDYLKMMWRRINFLESVLEMGYNFIFTDADIMWFRDPFPHFHPNTDFQIACDHFSGDSSDIENRPNGGFKFVRSNNRSIEFYRFWYSSRETYPGLHDQDVLNRIKNDSFIREIGLKMRFLDTAYFGGFCEPSKDLNQVCTMHANCCFGLDSKLHDLRILLEDWKLFMALPPSLKSSDSSWRVPESCSLDSLRHFGIAEDDVEQFNNSEVFE
ncbi:Nucleotide-diphospho-sugar transferase family protein [Abeliophyllum distichum]|uniref:Nucleotide-diphospho-sugar transferase family protein n=1 Tax=Abeliophyllum distichum TaxID=126358 RepID=A0ABD1U0Z6_9LAMI